MAGREQAELRIRSFTLGDLAGIDLNDVVPPPIPAQPPPLVAPVAGDDKRGVIILVTVGQLADKVRGDRLHRARSALIAANCEAVAWVGALQRASVGRAFGLGLM